MVKLGHALTILLSTTAIQSSSGLSVHNIGSGRRLQSEVNTRRKPVLRASESRLNVAASASAGFAESGETLSDALLTNATAVLNNATATTFESLSGAVSDAVKYEDDAEELEIKQRSEKVQLRAGSYRVVFPIITDDDTSLGLSLRQVDSGRKLSDVELDLDSLETSTPQQRIGWKQVENLNEKVGETFRGVIVHSVKPDGIAWLNGVRPGDVVVSSSAPLGDSLWPKSNLAGITSSVLSRTKASATDYTVEFKRVIEKVDNKYELTLQRPIGFLIQDSEEGYVEVTGFKDTATTLVKYAVQVGDRVVAVESALGGRLWPVSTADGVISAVTARLPGQPVTICFERPDALLNKQQESLEQQSGATDEIVKQYAKEETAAGTTVFSQPSVAARQAAVVQEKGKPDDQVLLKRCRETLRRFTTEDNSEVKSRFMDKFALPAMVADKVMDALMAGSVCVDERTLSMIMGAYLSCGNSQGAIRAFELVTGLNGDGSSVVDTLGSEGEDCSKRIVPNKSALNLFTVNSLLQSHALNGDVKSVERVLAALEGKSGSVVNGLDVGEWPGAGTASLRPDTRCYNIAISAATKNGGEDGLTTALNFFAKLKEPTRMIANGAQEQPNKNVVSYNTIISALTSQGWYEEAFIEFTKMKQAGVRPDKYTYTSLLSACTKDGDMVELLYDMQEKGVKADVVTYNTVIKSFCDEGNLSEARKVISQMESKGISPDSRTYGLLMTGLLQAKQPQACLSLFEAACRDIRTAAMTENVYLYTTAISAASIMKDHERALELVNRMNGIGIKPNIKTLTALMGACLASKRPDFAAQVYDKIKDPDGYAISQGLRALCGVGEIEKASSILMKEPHRGKQRRLSGKQLMIGYETVLKAALTDKNYDLARVVFSDLLKKGNIPSSKMNFGMIEAMGFTVTKKGMIVTKKDNEFDDDKFKFLLFLLDSLRTRNLPSDGHLYATTIATGNTLGGVYRKLVSYLKQARKESDTEYIVKSNGDASSSPNGTVAGWQDLLLQYEKEEKQLQTDKGENKKDNKMLPFLSVRIAKRDQQKVFKAEIAVVV